ncbi:MAG: lysophospholipid acyltransferase family protein [Bryobacterales bacterium]|nr:lysophospholipid acyltransferase family protein [Bryobacterales bacterium]
MSFALLRSILVTAPLVALSTAVMATISVASSLFDSTGRAPHHVARAWARMLLVIFRAKVTIEGIEKLRPDSSYVFASNHLSYIDTPVILASIPEQFRFLAKESLFKIPFLGHHMKRAGYIPVPLDDPRPSVRVMTSIRVLAAAARMVRDQNVSVLVFPEGERTNGTLQEFKEGAAYIAIKSGAPIVPLALRGTREIMAAHTAVVRGGRVRLMVGDPIPAQGLTLKDRERLTASVRERIAAMLDTQTNAAAR